MEKVDEILVNDKVIEKNLQLVMKGKNLQVPLRSLTKEFKIKYYGAKENRGYKTHKLCLGCGKELISQVSNYCKKCRIINRRKYYKKRRKILLARGICL